MEFEKGGLKKTEKKGNKFYFISSYMRLYLLYSYCRLLFQF